MLFDAGPEPTGPFWKTGGFKVEPGSVSVLHPKTKSEPATEPIQNCPRTGTLTPSIGSSSVVHPDRPMSSDIAQKQITVMAKKAGIRGAEYFTTHCFRQGGAQYHFMFAPIGKRWTLARIRWWGGWAQGEHVCCYLLYSQMNSYRLCQRDTLIKYLLDELYTYEGDHCDALNPFDSLDSISIT